MEQENIPIEKYEDYSIEKLEVKKRICEEKLEEISKYSFWLRLSKKLGFDIYRLSFIMMFIGIGIYAIIMVIFIAITFLYENQIKDILPMELMMKIMMIAFFIMIPFVFIISTDKRGPYKSRLKEINRAIRIKNEVNKKYKTKKSIDNLEEENECLEYKSSFKYNYKTKNPDPKLQNEVIQAIVGLLNSNGGNLIIGVNDKREFIGIEKDLKLFNNNWDNYELAIRNKINQHIESPISNLINIEQIEKDGKIGCNISIKKSNKPIWFKDKNEEIFFVRDGNSTRKYSGRKEFDYIKENWM